MVRSIGQRLVNVAGNAGVKRDHLADRHTGLLIVQTCG
jgi:hypothetical protein